MANMKALVIYQSIHHHNTVKVAEAIAEALDADLKKVSEVESKDVMEYDLIGFGSGIFWGKHHASLLRLVDGLPIMEDKKVFIFSTSGMSNSMNFLHNIKNRVSHFHGILRKSLQAKGAMIIGEYSCRGYDTAGPLTYIGGINRKRPNDSDIRKAKEYASDIKGMA